jgi:dipeptidyl-peptidase-4
MTTRWARVGAMGAVIAGLFAAGCAPADRADPGPGPRHPMIGALAQGAKPPERVTVLGPEASPITFERMARTPEPGWAVPRAIAFSPDGAEVTFLASDAGEEELALFAFDTRARTTKRLARAADLLTAPAKMSREEELRRERQRQRGKGLTTYAWAKKARVMLIPLGGDLFVHTAAGAIERLTDTPEPELDPQICPTGERVAFVRGREVGVVEVATKRVTMLTSGAPEGVTRGQSDFNAQEELDEPHGLFWSPRCDALAVLEVDERKVAEVPVLGRRDGKADLMMQRYPLAGGTNPSVKLEVIDVATKKATWVRPPGDGEAYFTRLRFAPDGRAIYLQWIARDQKRLALVRADLDRPFAADLAVETSTTWLEPTDVWPLEKSHGVLWITQASGRRHLEVRDGVNAAKLATVTSGDWDVEDVVGVDEDRGLVLFTGTKDGPLERHLYRARLDGTGAVERLTSEPGVHAPVSDARGRTIADVHSASTRLPKAVVRDDAGAPLGELPVAIDADVEALRIRPPKLVTVPGPGGAALHGALLEPRVVEPGRRYPAIVMVYGGPGVQTVLDRWAPRLFWQHLADRGFVVFQLDNRGTAGRGHAFEAASHGRLGAVELEDQLAGLAWLSALPLVDGARVGVHGVSYGGFLTALAMLGAPGKFRAGVAGAPVTDFRLYDAAYTERYLGTPATNPAGYAGTDLARLAPKLEGSLLLVHGMLDENVHFENTSHLVDALITAGKPFDELVLPGERHGWRAPAARRYVYERVARYFAEHL